ncbi:MAG TPA: helicase-associated domain-containing protein [Anaerolineales bacterium]|nr:helicase-associated domain-containing protein [Anaerolineales bacterium]
MPTLSECLQGFDLGHLHIIARLWGLELAAPDVRAGLQQLEREMLDPLQAAETVAGLPGEVQAALEDLALGGGRMPWALFVRRYGELREMGPARRDREMPYLEPVSATERLWYRGLVGRAFFDTAAGPEEYAYIPDDLIERLPPPRQSERAALGRAALPVERARQFQATDRLLEHACTLLAALRMGRALPSEPYALGPLPLPAEVLKALLAEAGLLDAASIPQPEAARQFLEAGRGEALGQLARAWLKSQSFNELRLLPGLSAEGSWLNEPLKTRQTVLGFLANTPAGTWWSLPAFITAIKQRQPDFQRPHGNYDAWHLRDTHSGEFLRGFEHWEAVDGALVRYLVSGPLHWLGILDLAAPSGDKEGEHRPVTAFRWSAWAQALLQGKDPAGLPAEQDRLKVRSDARLHAPRRLPRLARYQLARFCEWEKEDDQAYTYRLTPASLARARQQGLTMGHLLGLLRRHAESMPPTLVRALERWEEQGSAARLESLEVLRFSSPEVLQALRQSRASRFLGEPLGPAAIAIKPGSAEKVLAALAELGYLGEIKKA